MKVGIPRELKDNEYRVAIRPVTYHPAEVHGLTSVSLADPWT